jgi:hypothetical protein
MINGKNSYSLKIYKRTTKATTRRYVIMCKNIYELEHFSWKNIILHETADKNVRCLFYEYEKNMWNVQ